MDRSIFSSECLFVSICAIGVAMNCYPRSVRSKLIEFSIQLTEFYHFQHYSGYYGNKMIASLLK